MIIKNKHFQIIKMTVPLVLFLIVVRFSFKIENNKCMGINLVPIDEYEKLLLQKNDDSDVEFLFNNKPAATDYINNVIYISQNITDETTLSDLSGVLSTKNPNYQLVMKKDNSDNLFEIVSNGQSYNILAISPAENCVEYRIIFTTLPVINITGEDIGVATNGKTLYRGEFTFSDPNSVETGSYRTVGSTVQWHVRGNTTANQPKKPWKLSLKKENGENENLSFCGLGEDDDWILNPMNLDDLKIREKIMMDLWNQNEYFTNHNIIMSQGEYVELVLNGEYYGLYLLQRRLDKKYLNISDEDILLKNRNMPPQSSVSSETMEIVYSPFTEEETVKYLQEHFDGKYIPFTNIENWINLNNYIQMACSVDNRQSKNIVMLLDRDDGNDFSVNYILWDTDMSFGLQWDTGYVYDYNRTVFANAIRFEYSQLSQLYPTLDINMANSWTELRQTLFSDENLYSHIDKLYNIITQSNSLQRDFDKWGIYYNGVDTMEQLRIFITARMEYIDNYYSVSKN